MMRPRYIWLAFGLCLAVGAAAMGWLGHTVARLDAERAAHLRDAAREERVRLALWRMDSALGALIARESLRPEYMYTAFYPAERAYTRLYAQLRPGEILVASPLLTYSSPHIRLHFAVSPPDVLTSPQAPQGNMRDLAETGYVEHETINAAEELLERLRREIGVVALASAAPLALEERRQSKEEEGLGQQVALNSLEYAARELQSLRQRAQAPQKVVMQEKTSAPLAQSPRVAAPTDEAMAPPREWNEGDLAPAWVGDELFLLRWVRTEDARVLQGCWLDWPALRPWLLESVRDLLPEARLEALRDGARRGESEDRRLAALPVLLAPGPALDGDAALPSPTRVLLWAALACIAVATLAVVSLMAGAMALSERRRAFVSAVTHELRTPLTTFQMYTEMLAGGMVRSEEKRQHYLETLHAESNRLAHLIENVLSYARLERNRIKQRLEEVPALELLDGATRRLEQRAGQAGMELVADAPDTAPALRVDRDAIERILFNLVDNACKYAADAEDRRIHLSLRVSKRHVEFRVRDHGPGVTRKERRRIFHAFTKASRDASHAAPGVGLGLGLSRRLARAMGGRLDTDLSVTDGACFVLRLPVRD